MGRFIFVAELFIALLATAFAVLSWLLLLLLPVLLPPLILAPLAMFRPDAIARRPMLRRLLHATSAINVILAVLFLAAIVRALLQKA